ncbi:MAG: hypothetical protein IPN78_10340 [Candidatus Accumulibacter sp.]|nr:hypothetical protein [Candidatus Accumulibacter propinquus]
MPGVSTKTSPISNERLLAANLSSNAATAALRTSLMNTSGPFLRSRLRFTGNVNPTKTAAAFFQMLYLDFFVRVDNIASLDTADSFNVLKPDFFSGTLKLTSSPLAAENIVERSSLRNLQKTVRDCDRTPPAPPAPPRSP